MILCLYVCLFLPMVPGFAVEDKIFFKSSGSPSGSPSLLCTCYLSLHNVTTCTPGPRFNEEGAACLYAFCWKLTGNE